MGGGYAEPRTCGRGVARRRARTDTAEPSGQQCGHRTACMRGPGELRTGGWGVGSRCPARRASAVPRANARTLSRHPSR
eukprot:4158400-Pleurochrysis_carterae.AAC.3